MEWLLNVYRSLTHKDKALVWVAAVAIFVVVVSSAGNGLDTAALAQIASATGTLILASLAYAQVRELRETRVAQERPQVIVDADYRSPLVYIVVRNIGKGAARDITFEFSTSLESTNSVEEHSLVAPVDEQPYFQRGIDYLASGAEISCLWDSMITLPALLRERELEEGITITSRYRSLVGESYETAWTINPLLMADRLYTPQKGINEIAEAAEEVAGVLSQTVEPWRHGELRVSTDTGRLRRQEQNE